MAKQRKKTLVVRRVVVRELEDAPRKLSRWLGLNGLRTDDLAARMGLAGGHAISMLWQRASINEDTLARLSAAMGVDLDWWDRPLERWRRPPRDAVVKAIDKESDGISATLRLSLPSRSRSATPSSQAPRGRSKER